MLALAAMAAAPVMICLAYMYVRDKYEKEPRRLLAVGVFMGAVITFPVIQTENAVTSLMPVMGIVGDAAYTAFCVAGFVEETFKFIVLASLTWRNRNLNEPLDGIVYAVFISLGFAGAENLLYVLNPDIGGFATAWLRAFTAVPAHMVFGVFMGYFFARARLFGQVALNAAMALISAWAAHGVFDFFLLCGLWWATAAFGVLFIAMGVLAVRGINKYVRESPFRTV